MRSLVTLIPLLLAVGLLVSVGSSNSSLADLPANERDRIDEQAIRTLMRQLRKTWNRRDLTAFSAHFTEEADLVDRAGPWVRRRAEIEEYLSRAYARDTWDRTEAPGAAVLFDAVQMIAPDVALVLEQRRESTRKTMATYVLMKQDDRWRIRSLAITPIDNSP